MDIPFKKGDRVFRKDRTGLGTVLKVFEIGNTVLVEWKSCGNYYTTNANLLELVPADHKFRWR